MLYDTVLPGVGHPPFSCHGCEVLFSSTMGTNRAGLDNAVAATRSELEEFVGRYKAKVPHNSPECPLLGFHTAVLVNASNFEDAVQLQGQVSAKLSESGLPDSNATKPD